MKTKNASMGRGPKMVAPWENGACWPGRVARHDLIYLSPPADPLQGIPLGNGDIGALVWCEDSRLIVNLNKCDLWEDGKSLRFGSGGAEEGLDTTLRHAGRLIIDFKLPIFDLFYIDDFHCRLNLAEASLELKADSPFGSINLKAFVAHQSGLFCCELARDFKEPAPMEIVLERFGSNTFNRWYCSIKRDPRSGLLGTESFADKNGIYIRHPLRNQSFAVGCRVFRHTGAKMRCQREHGHAARVRLEGKLTQSVMFTVGVTSPTSGNPIAEVNNKIKTAGARGFAGLLAPHKKTWKSFWLRSYMECGDDYLDNLWHLTMYYANCSQTGRYPGRFIHGLWGWNRDVQPWNFYFHWNQQQTYWPLNAAGHHDLLKSYLDFRFNTLPPARQVAREIFHTDGAFVSDVCDRRGYGVSGFGFENNNHTPVVQIAMDFWRQYLYTGDKVFLREKALPYMLEAARFFESCFEKGKDSLYHGRRASGYESGALCTDALPEIVYARILFAAVLRALDEAGIQEARGAKWKDIRDHVAPVTLIPGGEKLLAKSGDGWKLIRGPFKGDLVASDHILTAGFGIDEKRHLTARVPNDKIVTLKGGLLEIIQSFLKADGIPDGNATDLNLFMNRENMDIKGVPAVNPAVEYSAVFPSGLIGLAQKQSAEFKAAVTTAKLYAPEMTGWDPLPIVMARLGLSGEIWEILRKFPGHWQINGNGCGYEAAHPYWKPEANFRFLNNNVSDGTPGPDCGKKHPFPAWPFRHMGMEPMAVLSCAMNEALLQSYDGVLRAAPAVSSQQNARFSLHAAGGFVVSAEIIAGKPAWIFIRSLLGNKCRLENPWPQAYVNCKGKQILTTAESMVEFDTVKDGRYLVVPDEKVAREWKLAPVVFAANQEPKTSADGNTGLGLPRMFARSVADREAYTDFVTVFQVSKIMPFAGDLSALEYPTDKNILKLAEKAFHGNFADIHEYPGVSGSDGVMYFVAEIECKERMKKLEICLGYDGPVKAWLDGRQIFHDPKGTNPALADKARIPVKADKGRHEIMIALALNHGKACGVFLRFKRGDLKKNAGIIVKLPAASRRASVAQPSGIAP